MLDPQKRYEMLAKAEAMITKSKPIIPIWTPATTGEEALRQGMYPNPGSMFAWSILIEHDPANGTKACRDDRIEGERDVRFIVRRFLVTVPMV